MTALVPHTLCDDADAEKLRHGVCEYLESMSQALCEIAYDNGLDTLAIIFERARADARRIIATSDKHFDRT
jgi:hypothetical protein